MDKIERPEILDKMPYVSEYDMMLTSGYDFQNDFFRRVVESIDILRQYCQYLEACIEALEAEHE